MGTFLTQQSTIIMTLSLFQFSLFYFSIFLRQSIMLAPSLYLPPVFVFLPRVFFRCFSTLYQPYNTTFPSTAHWPIPELVFSTSPVFFKCIWYLTTKSKLLLLLYCFPDCGLYFSIGFCFCNIFQYLYICICVQSSAN